ncbi:MAG: YlbE-like family protein [Bacillota bacterium]|uniref:YlbE-like family protein n=1 Tax=Virgibacillus salarius TaxID=447199 RepID=A0A941DTS7_9BACI|nr:MULTISPECIES: YlbE-like family protein [Bacillaceae]NAZ08067.1 hypothetical protein [Agaribacter marinus]MBR7795352.1 YlbE-like family protein [Virgibacillus salarius]MCC2249626.1 YlbE-like family protein [Virgibacillus sp. AGTR]MDY7044206.1 YlbE-like family protein [Virgibacillus sp. M23]QRZ16853.1 YlbE-like family protein [Virgibacillus sp. AGTR]
MDPNSYNYLRQNPELLRFVRLNPIWYRYLSRDPNLIEDMRKESKRFYGKTFPQQVEKVNNHIQMVGMLMQFAGAMKD